MREGWRVERGCEKEREREGDIMEDAKWGIICSKCNTQ